jgi:hypothetical protein
MDITDFMVVEWLIGSAAVIVALLVVVKFGYTTYKAIHRIDQMLGVDRQGRTISDRLERVEYQLFPNGGTSLADRVNQIAFDQRAIEGEMKAVKDIIGVTVEGK